MTETTVPRVAKFADLRVGMTIESVRTLSSGTTVTYVGVASEVTDRVASSREGVWLAAATDDDDDSRVTLRILEEPPTPALPTTPGTVITCTLDGHPGAVLVLDGDGDWSGVDTEGFCTSVYTSRPASITDWTVVYDPNAPAADPLDENDHRGRFDKHDHMVVRVGPGQWNNCGETPCGGKDLAWWSNHFGPLRFADEVTA